MGTAVKQSSWRSHLGMALTLLLVIGLATLLFGAHRWKRDLSVSSVVVRGARILPEADIVGQAAVSKGDRLFAIDLSGVKRRVEANPYVQRATVQRDVPDRITIIVEERLPIAAIMTDRLLYLDADGYVLPAAHSEHMFDLPVITGTVPTAECVTGKKVSSGLVQDALALLRTAMMVSDDMYHRISEVRVEDQRDMVVYTAEYGIPVIVGKGNAPDKLMKLEAFWKNIVGRQGAQGLQYVDLRFEDQVVVRWNGGRSGSGE